MILHQTWCILQFLHNTTTMNAEDVITSKFPLCSIH